MFRPTRRAGGRASLRPSRGGPRAPPPSPGSCAFRPAEDVAAEMPHFLSFKSLKPYVDQHLGDLQTLVVKYRTESGQIAHGIRAEIIPKICDVWIDADEHWAPRPILVDQTYHIVFLAFL